MSQLSKGKSLESLINLANHINYEVIELKRRMLALKSGETLSVEEEYSRRFPHAEPDPEVISLIGIDAYISLEDEKEELMNTIERTYGNAEDIS